ncbi:unnamed protein product [Spirodela intermedia]|uniref:Uncharacterized protein n=1 Tax=Spirodela intermedia TaxID=51605 RepID=A0A7I8J5Q1_SPIIN|nr:unnamed protein product [Spirodela intermedia]CAA6665557.1 unnamed protein product [Spirodela intermedia]
MLGLTRGSSKFIDVFYWGIAIHAE